MIHISKEIIFENLAGRSSPLQKQIIAEWLEKRENIELYYEWLDDWENTNLQFLANEEAALKKITLSREETVSEIRMKPQGFIQRFLNTRMFAASLLAAMLISSLFVFQHSILYTSIKTGYGEIRPVTLPDGSKVIMNSNSIIEFPRFGFGKSSRVVHLTGEADFSVVHTQHDQKFIVKTGKQLDVTVLGTQFSVYARESRATVVLQNGKVELSYIADKAHQTMIMKPGDVFTANDRIKPQLQHVPNPEKLTAWKNHEFLFNATALSEIAVMIKDNFGFDVKFESTEIAGRKISGSFHAEAFDELIDAIGDLLNINYRIKDKTILFFQ